MYGSNAREPPPAAGGRACKGALIFPILLCEGSDETQGAQIATSALTTKSWGVSIRHALRQIAAVNTRRKVRGWYVSEEELRTLLEGVYESALDWATLEAHEGIYSASELEARHERSQLLAEAFEKIQQAHG